MTENRVAALVSGGLDSCVMLGELAKTYDKVIPVYVRCGLRWEKTEIALLRNFVDALGASGVKAVQILHVPMEEVYGEHWSTGGDRIPGYHDPDDDWEIPGRNLMLITKTAVWCKRHDICSIALGSLMSNRFSDATPEFFEHLQQALRSGLKMDLRIIRPLAKMRKSEIIRLGQRYPLESTLSCANPVGRDHCGRCGKCRERIEAFAEAKVVDRTRYAQRIIM